MPLPVLLTRVPDLFGGVAEAVIGPPVLPVKLPAFQIKRDAANHLLDGEARPDACPCAIDQRIDEDASLLRIKCLVVNRMSHFRMHWCQ